MSDILFLRCASADFDGNILVRFQPTSTGKAC
jgi:hypothetical protein